MAEVSLDTVIVGIRFKPTPARSLVAKLQPGDVVALQREPQNREDPRAVACVVDGIPVGYIPRVANPQIAWAMDRGWPVWCTVREAAVVRLDTHRIIKEPKLTVHWRTP